MSDPPDSELLVAARDGDRKALTTLVERHQGRIYRFAMRTCGDPEDAREVLQETLLSMVRNLDGFRGDASLSTWLFTVARNHCLQRHRTSKFAPQMIESLNTDPPGDIEADPEVAAASREIESALQQAIAGLDERYGEVLVLRDVEGLTAPEVAEVLGLSASAVKSRLHRARMAVRAQLEPLFQVPTETVPGEACPDVLMMFSQHVEGELSQSTCAEMERHLERCPRCRGTCDSLKRMLTQCRATDREVPVPPAIQASVQTALRNFLADP